MPTNTKRMKTSTYATFTKIIRISMTIINGITITTARKTRKQY